MHVVATAGHVDHGKSTLVLALTGTDPDRFAEEKARGLTIDLGFAFTTLASGRGLAFVDVPGHVRFLKNMLAGVGAVDACLFVVAATEGWKPQSEEHLRILDVLGIRGGVVALTKVGLVDADDAELARLEIAEQLAGTFLAGAEVVGVDAPTGVGLIELRDALDRLLETTPTAVDLDRPRLWVDRAFAAKGAGTVVTGTLAGGSLRVDENAFLVPAGRAVRIRGLQTHGSSLDVATPGRRLAVNLGGVAHTDVRRGDALVRPGQWELTQRFDATLRILAGLDHDVSRRGAFAVYLGSGEYAAKLRVLGPAVLEPGSEGLVRIHLPSPVALLPGDRYVLRENGRGETIGGGEVLDIDPLLPATRAVPTRSVDRVIAERGWVDVDLLERLTGERREPDVGRWVVAPSELSAAQERLRSMIEAASRPGAGGSIAGVDLAGLDERDRSVVASLEGVRVELGRATLGEVTDPWSDHPYVAALEASPFRPPTPEEAGVSRADVRELVRRALVVERDGFYFGTAAVEHAARIVAGVLAAASPDGVTAAELRDALDTTRKYLLPLLSHLDAAGITRRRGDLRIAGPRLP